MKDDVLSAMAKDICQTVALVSEYNVLNASVLDTNHLSIVWNCKRKILQKRMLRPEIREIFIQYPVEFSRIPSLWERLFQLL